MSHRHKSTEELHKLHSMVRDKDIEVRRLTRELYEVKAILERNTIRNKQKYDKLLDSNCHLINGAHKMHELISASARAGCPVSRTYVEGLKENE